MPTRWVLLNRLRYRLVPRNLSTVRHVGVDVDDLKYSNVPKPRKRKSERKPYVTPMKILIERAKEDKEARKEHPCRMLEQPPDNGLLVPELVDVAQRVYQSRNSLLFGLSQLVQVIPVQRCRFCSEVHIGRVGHQIRTCTGPESGFRSATHVWRKARVQDVAFFPKSYHLYDRVGKPRVVHDEKHIVQRIPAIVELCIQAGVDLKKYATKRRTRPVYSIEGRIVDFESIAETSHKTEENLIKMADCHFNSPMLTMPQFFIPNGGGSCSVDEIKSSDLSGDGKGNSFKVLSCKTLESWFDMISGAKKIMEKYTVNTCGYCPEVQVGPQGHKVRICKATKHQSRNGLHAWQEATVDDIVGLNYVWHVRDLNGPALENNLKRFYGKAPAVVELCVHAGAPVPDQYRSMMRLDVVCPDRDEVDLVV